MAAESVVTREAFEAVQRQLAAAQGEDFPKSHRDRGAYLSTAMLAATSLQTEQDVPPSSDPTGRTGDKSAPVAEQDSDITMGSPVPVIRPRGSVDSATANPTVSESDESDVEMTVLEPGSRVADVVEEPNQGVLPGPADEVPRVPRPDGVAGRDFSIQIAMGLAGLKGSAKHSMYLSIQRRVRDYVNSAQLSCETEWRHLPKEDLSKLYRVARTTMPFLKRFVDDWATEELAKGYLRNKRQHLYKIGELTPPAKYAYLKANAAKRDPTGSRRRKALVEAEAAKKMKSKKVALASKKGGKARSTHA
ncbi:hypothetical protein K525DRAFT_248714 [Schizophyllum commune Loenen D]|nr:hypothetical protein K525DRAFT_248714 [Schizophyllum commune Loenen D]